MRLLYKAAVLLIITLLLIAMTTTAFAVEDDNEVSFKEVNQTVYVIYGSVNVRTGPGTDYSRIDTLPYGASIQRIGIGDNGWSKVIYNGQEAYMYSDYLSTTNPAAVKPKVDYTKLTRGIAVANGLKETDYTKESWEAVADALVRANLALNSSSQATVDDSLAVLEGAVAALVKMDRSALEQALSEYREFIDAEAQHGQWNTLIEAANNGKALLDSTDQSAVNDGAEQLRGLLAQVRAMLEAQKTPETITKEVYVEVPPTDDYCNIPVHRVWPVAFFCSLALNIALVALIVVYLSKKKNQKDDTPLVDYDIGDDLF